MDGDLVALASPLVPLAFLGVAIQRRLGQARIAELAARIGAADEPGFGPQGLQAELRRALADPALDVRYWVDGGVGRQRGQCDAGRLARPVPRPDHSS